MSTRDRKWRPRGDVEDALMGLQEALESSLFPSSLELRGLVEEVRRQAGRALEHLPAEFAIDDHAAPWRAFMVVPGFTHERTCHQWLLAAFAPCLGAEQACWALLATEVLTCPNDFGRAAWLTLLCHDLNVVRWLVDAAALLQVACGVSPDRDLAECVEHLEDLKPGARGELDRLAQETGPVAAAARVLLRIRKGARFYDVWSAEMDR